MCGWTWAAASRRGTGHIDMGERRQDAFRVVTVDPGFLVAVACDGAGSAPYGGLGAALAARTLSVMAEAWVAESRALPPPEQLELWTVIALQKIEMAAARLGTTANDFATTVVFAVSDGTSTTIAHIGDGAVVARATETNEWVDLSWPESGEYAATTFFLTDLVPRLRISVVAGLAIDRLALLTDGLERLALDFARRMPHTPFFDGLFRPIEDSVVSGQDLSLSRRLGSFLSSDAVNARTDDDKTLILATLR